MSGKLISIIGFVLYFVLVFSLNLWHIIYTFRKSRIEKEYYNKKGGSNKK